MKALLKKILPLAAVLAVALPAGQAFAAQKSKFRFDQPTYVATEGQGGIDLTVTRAANHGKNSKTNQTSNVTVSVTGGSATEGASDDYTFGGPITLAFGPGQTTKTVHIGINQDTAVEGIENVALKLSGASPNALITNPRTAQLLIADDDGPTQVSLVPASQNVSEAAGSATFFAVRSGDLTNPAGSSADIASSDGSAGAPGDYTAISPHTITFAGPTGTTPPEFSKQVDVPVIDDTVIEPSESFNVSLSDVSDAVFPNNAASVTASATIVDNDSAPVFALDATSYQVNENGSVDVTVNRLPNLAPGQIAVNTPDLFTVDWTTTDGSATNPADYLPSADRTLEFDSTDSAETITVSASQATQIGLVDDAIAESDETFGLGLANPTSTNPNAVASLGSPSSATVTIHDNDSTSGDTGTVTVTPGDGGSGSTGNPTSNEQDVLGARQSACRLVVSAVKKQKLLKQKGLKLKLRSSQRCKVSLATTITQLKSKSKKRQAQIVRALRLKGKQASLTLAPGKAKTVTVRFTKKILKAIKKALQARKSLVATVVVSERDAASNLKKRTLKITIRR